MNTQSWDAIVIGGGPGGAVVATCVAMQRHRVLLLEKEQTPVHKIGESLLPSTVHGICPLLGVSDELHRANFIRKNGGTFIWGAHKEPWTFEFVQSSHISGPTSFAYQVERMKFDQILLENAKRKGVDVRRGHEVIEILYDASQRCDGVIVRNSLGEKQRMKAQFVVDASGPSMMCGREVGKTIYSPFFRTVAVFGYYRNGKRLSPPNDGNIFSVAFPRGWFWYIPLAESLTSVGAVICQEHVSILQTGREAALEALIAECEPIRELLSGAARLTSGPYGQVRVRKDYSYCQTQFWRPGLALVGDAACFVDPVFSSGVHLATYAGLMAARSINSCLSGTVPEQVAFNEFERRYRREYGYFYEFLRAFYDVHEEVESYYWAARKILNCSEQGRDAFIALVAGIGGSGERLFGSEEYMADRRMPLSHDLFPLAVQSTHTPQPDGLIRRQRFVNGMFKELTQLQTQALLGERRIPEKPLFADGLVPAADGFHWCMPVES